MASVRTYRRIRVLGAVAAIALAVALAPTVANAQQSPTDLHRAAPTTYADLRIQVESARTVGTINAGDPIPAGTHYTWLISADDTGSTLGLDGSSPSASAASQAAFAACQNTDPTYPTNCQWPSVRQTPGAIAVVAQGTETNLNATTALSGLGAGRYLISVLADGYTLGGAHFTMPLTMPVLPVQVEPNPVPTGTMRIRVFHDNAPVDATYEEGSETGNQGGQQSLAGFQAHLTDVLGEVTNDWFGNPLCTNYLHDSAGKVLFDSKGTPIIDRANPGGKCLSDPNGDIVIPNLGSNRYGVTLSKPYALRNWVQTTTLEGGHDHDVWVMNGDTGFDTEVTIGGEPVPWVQFGYVAPMDLPAAPQGAHITGQILAGLSYVGGNGGVTMPGGTGTAGGKEGPPIDRPWIALSDLGNGDKQVYTGRGNTDGTFDIPNVPDGSYQLTAWDDNQDYIIYSFNVTVKNHQNVHVGKQYLTGWSARVYGTVFLDKNGNGRRDPGEPGIPGTVLTLRERDNSLMDQMMNSLKTNDAGEYNFKETYPLTKWIILENLNPRYETTGITVQGENDPTSKTYLGNAADINVLPVLGLGGRIDWGVRPYAPNTNGGIVGTVTYDSTRNELNAKYSATEAYQPGIPGITVHLWSVLKNTDINSPSYGMPIVDGRGLPQRDTMLSTTVSEAWQPPKGCVARQWDGSLLTGLGFIPAAGQQTNNATCVESPAMGFQAAPASSTGSTFDQQVNGNYSFKTSDVNMYPVGDPNNPGYPANYTGPCNNNPNNCAPGHHDLPQYASMAAYGYAPQPLTPGDYIVTVDIPTNPVGGGPMYQVTKEQDVNIFTGDSYLPQENYPLAPSGSTNPPDATGGNQGSPASMGPGKWASCVGMDQPVHVTNPDFLAHGGSPYEGLKMPLCDQKVINLGSQQSTSTNFNLFTPTPLPTHFWGLTINDLGLTWDPRSIQYGEAQGLPNLPMGIYDWSGHLMDTVSTDFNGFYEAIEPSTSSYNCPLPAGPCPNVYRFVGNDPGQPGAANPNYNPRYRTISANFQAWPGLYTTTDTAPTQTGAVSVTPGTTTPVPVSCNVSNVTPEVFAVSNPIVPAPGTTSRSVTVTGQGFGAGGTLQLLNNSGVVVATPAPTSWSDRSITFTVPTGLTGPLQLRVQDGGSGLWSSSAITLQVTSASYNPVIYYVKSPPSIGTPGNTDFWTVQSALSYTIPRRGNTTSTYEPNIGVSNAVLRARESNFGRIVLVWPGTPGTFNPTGAYYENPIMNKEQKLQGFGPGGVYSDGTVVPGSVIDGSAFNPDNSTGTNWLAIANLPHAGPAGVPDGAVVTVEPTTPFGGDEAPPLGFAAIDGFRITGGLQQDVPGNLNAITGANVSGFGASGAAITQGGGIYVHAQANNLHITNDLIIGNSGSYGGGIRVGTPYEPVSNNHNYNLKISYNRIRDNGGTNLAGGIGLFAGSRYYSFDHNDVCGNFSAEYGGGLSVFGLSQNGVVTANRFWFNEAYDEGGGVFLAGELTANPTALSPGTGPQTISRNEIVANTADDDGGGLRIMMVNNAQFDVTSNIIADNLSTHEGGGIALDDATNVHVVNDTIARNITTATAVTSDGRPAPAGLSTGRNSASLQALLNQGSPNAPVYSRPYLLNDVFWQNMAGSWNGAVVSGIGINGSSDINYWDMGAADGSGILYPRHSTLTTPNTGQITQTALCPGGTGLCYPGTDVPTTATSGSPFFAGITTDTSPAGTSLFKSPYAVSVAVSTLRTFPGFRQSVIVVSNLSPDLLGNYHLANNSTIAQSLGTTIYQFPGFAGGATQQAPQYDIDGDQFYPLPLQPGTIPAGADKP